VGCRLFCMCLFGSVLEYTVKNKERSRFVWNLFIFPVLWIFLMTCLHGFHSCMQQVFTCSFFYFSIITVSLACFCFLFSFIDIWKWYCAVQLLCKLYSFRVFVTGHYSHYTAVVVLSFRLLLVFRACLFLAQIYVYMMKISVKIAKR
jgi:hypothetical protein